MMDWADEIARPIAESASDINEYCGTEILDAHNAEITARISFALRKAKADGMREAANLVKIDAADAEGNCDYAALFLVSRAAEIEKGNA